MAVNLTALAFIFCYYSAVLLLAFWSRYRERRNSENLHISHISTEGRRRRLVHRSMPLFLGVGSMTATWVGGGYLNGTAEAVYKNGILHCHTPLGYACSLVIGGTFFTDKMRALKPLTMLDPFQHRYGRWMALLLCLPAVAGEVFWTAAVLAALGDTAGVILEVEVRFFVVMSAMVVFFYTSLGGFNVVTRTDVLQILTTAVCLWICVPACLGSRVVGTVGPPHNDWIGNIKPSDLGSLFDRFVMTALGGVPWQVYFQRVLSSESDFDARMLSYLSAVGCLALAIPPAVIGAAAKSANFTAAGYHGPYHLGDKDSVSVLPYSIRYLTSGLVSILGMLGITAAIMSSVDSSMLSASLLVTKNIYQAIFRPTASEAEVALVLRMMVFFIGSWATYLALSVESVFEVWSLSSDVVYVLLFPQLLCLLYFKRSNTYGSLIGFIVGCGFRWLLGQPSLGVPVTIMLPLFDEEQGEAFPLRLTCMAFGVAMILLGSYSASTVFEKGWLPARYDVFRCCHHKHHTHGASGAHIMGSAHVTAEGHVHSEAPISGSAQQAWWPSQSPKKGSKHGAEGEVPHLGTKDAGSAVSKASTASRQSSTVDAEKARRSSTVDVTSRPRTGSSVDSSRTWRASSARQAWQPSHTLGKGSNTGAEDEVPDLGTMDAGSTASKVSTASRKTSTVDAAKIRKGSTASATRQGSNKARKASVGDVSSKISRSSAPPASAGRKASAADTDKQKRASSLGLKHASKDDSMDVMTWHPVKVAKSEHPSDAKKAVKRQGSLATGREASRRSLSLTQSKSQAVAPGGPSNTTSAAGPQPEKGAHKEEN